MDRKFWDNGNSFFFNCLICGFRKEIKSYEKIDASDLLEKNIYSLNYYKNKPVMSKKEIEIFLSKNPIQIRNGSISSGRHRVSAMIGRLIRGEEYIPFYKDKFIN